MRHSTFLAAGVAAVALGFAFVGAASAAEAGDAGTFTGASDHITTGKVEIAKDDQGYIVKFGPGFSLDGAPDPKVGFGKDGKFAAGTLIGKLKALKGAQTYRVPASMDIRAFDQVYVWCEKFSVPLGVAALN